MPRGIPNAKRDDTGMRYTTFHVPLAPNPKHLGTTYLKSDGQSLWYRNALRKREAAAEETVPQPEQRRGSQVIVIHPGSRWLRVGKACDVTPVSIPNVIARKSKPPIPAPSFVERISRPRKGKDSAETASQTTNGDEYAVSVSSDDPFDEKIAAITISLRDRMRFYKLRVTPNAAGIASTFNEQFKPEIIAEHNDPSRVEWIGEDCETEVLVGESALRIADPQASNYAVRWPILGTNFNTRDYPSIQLILSDIETMLRITLQERMGIEPGDYKNFSVVLVIPDVYDRAYVREWVNLLLSTMGFKQLCAQQESLAATYGAGISNACVVDIGAVTTSVACVDEGLVISDSRLSLNTGGDDITEFLYVLLQRINFPYREIDLARSYDWRVMEDLKVRLCTLAEGDVALNLYDFVVRQPNRPTEKYGLRAYDEIILAPMCIFEPRVIDFDRKRCGLRPASHPDVSDNILEPLTENATQAMIISTQHLIPSPPVNQADDLGTPNKGQPSSAAVSPPPSGSGETSLSTKQEQQEGEIPADDSISSATPVEGPPDAPMEIVDIEDEAKAAGSAPQQASSNKAAPASAVTPATNFPSIDMYFEASKLPLDVAIFNSARAAGGDEKIRKYLQAVLVIGGTAMIPGMTHALESRLQAIATPLVPNMEKVQIIPPPKEVDPRVLTWKGAAVLGKMDGVAELWITPSDWDILGMRGLKERCFYL